MEKELAAIVAKQSAMRENHMRKYRNGSATRAQTTTLNANIGRLQERAVWLREQIKLSKEIAS